VCDEFINHFFDTTKFNNSVLSNGEGGVRIYLFYENFSLIPISIPNLPEQKRIASLFTVLDKKIAELKRQKSLLEQYKKGLMEKLFSQELRFKDENGKVFPEWGNHRIGDVSKIQGGYAFKSSGFKESGIAVIRISNLSIVGNRINTQNLVYSEPIQNDKSFIIQKGDLLIAMSGGTTGKTCIYDLESPSYLNQRVGLFRKTSDKLNYQFLTHFIQSMEFQKQLKSVLASGAQPNIGSNDIEQFKFQLLSKSFSRYRSFEFYIACKKNY
jgi:type I restriction enzyme S subunit